MSPYDPAASSESPTHPDAPRAGGETPDILAELDRYLDAYRDAIIAEQYAGPEDAATDPDVDRAWERANERREALRASLLERHRDGEWESANAADLTGARWYCEHCDAWGTVEIVRLPQLDAENLVCLKCRYEVAAFIPASAGPSPERASPPINADDSRGHKSTSPCEKCGAMEVYVSQSDADDADFTIHCYACGMHYRVDGPDA